MRRRQFITLLGGAAAAWPFAARAQQPEKSIALATRLDQTPTEATMLQTFLKVLFAFVALGVVTGGAASAEECSGSITTEEVLRAEDARYAAQIANDFAAMEQMFSPELVYIRSVDGAVADKRAYIESMRSGTVKYRAMRRSDVRVRTYGCLAMITGFFELDLTVTGRDLSEQSRFHSVWAKRGQGVQFVSWQSTRVPPKQ